MSATFQRPNRLRSAVTSWLAMIVAFLALYVLFHLARTGADAGIALTIRMVSLFF